MLYADSCNRYISPVARKKGRQGEVTPVARNLIALRERLGLNQVDIANLIGVGQGRYSQWEGQTIPRAEYVAALALALGVSADDILKGLARKVGGSIVIYDRGGLRDEQPASSHRAKPA